MKAIAEAHKNRSLKELDSVLVKYKERILTRLLLCLGLCLRLMLAAAVLAADA